MLAPAALQGCAPSSSGGPGAERGAIAHRRLAEGEYVEHLPTGPPRGVLVIAHGSTEEDESQQDLRTLAETFVRRWTRFADAHGLIAVAPVFDHRFGSSISEPGIVLGGCRVERAATAFSSPPRWSSNETAC